MMCTKILPFVIILWSLLHFNAGFSQDAEFWDNIRSGNCELLSESLKDHPNFANSTNDRGFSPLILAAYHNQIACAKTLLNHGAQVNYNFGMGSALHGAAYQGYVDMVKLLISAGSDLNSQDENGSTPLIYATLGKHETCAKLLFSEGADPNIKDQTGSSAMDYAKSLSLKNLVDHYTK